jgi:hypothetical protein
MISGIISFFASIILLVCIFRHEQPRRNTVFHRLMMGMSIHDVLFSFGFALGRLPIPKELDVPRGLGTQGSCTAQAFLINTVNVAYIYAVSVSIYFLLIIRYKMSDKTVSKYIEPWMHFAAISWGYGLTWYVWSKELFNPTPFLHLCWMGSLPLGCTYIPGLDCVRGDNLADYTRNLYIIPNFIVFGCLLLSLAIVIITIRRQLVRNVQYAFRGENSSSQPSRVPTSLRSVAQSMRHRLSIFNLPVPQVTTPCHYSEQQQDPLSSPSSPAKPSTGVKPQDAHGSILCAEQQHSGSTPSKHPNASLNTIDDNLTGHHKDADIAIDSPMEQRETIYVEHPQQQQLPQHQFSRQSLHHSSTISPTKRVLSQAVTQSLCYGSAYSFCFMWTFILGTIAVFGDETKMLNEYFWVGSYTFVCVCVCVCVCKKM